MRSHMQPVTAILHTVDLYSSRSVFPLTLIDQELVYTLNGIYFPPLFQLRKKKKVPVMKIGKMALLINGPLNSFSYNGFLVPRLLTREKSLF